MEETTPSAREMDVLKVLWKLGEASVREVRQVLCPNEECASRPCKHCCEL